MRALISERQRASHHEETKAIVAEFRSEILLFFFLVLSDSYLHIICASVENLDCVLIHHLEVHLLGFTANLRSESHILGLEIMLHKC